MDKWPFWTIYHGDALTNGYENAPLLFSVGSSFEKLAAALDDWSQADAVLLEFEESANGLANPRIVGHLNEGKEALLVSVAPPPVAAADQGSA